MKFLLTTILTVLFTISGLNAQSNDYILLDKSTMTIEGTSTIHDWECDVEEIQADIALDLAAVEGEIKQNPVENLSLTIPVESIESGKGGMNKKMYGALEKDKFPNITFEMTNTELVQKDTLGTNGNESSFRLMASGLLTIAGTTNEVTFPVDSFMQDSNNTLKFTGSYELNMKDYNVDPPSAVFGTIKSGEMVTILFEVYFSNKQLN